jgi:formylglycine-generating enzyme
MKSELESGFLAAIREEPLDDVPWLVLADWLEEAADPRAELVRLQLLLRGELPPDDRFAAEDRARQLLRGGVMPCVPVTSNSVGMELALIRPGWFWMGSPVEEHGRYADEGPRRVVRITRPFHLGRYQVTQEQYRQVMGESPCHFSPSGGGADVVRGMDTRTFPMENVSWFDALAFCSALSALPEEQAAGRAYRLPTEAEWEYACRAGTTSGAPFHYGHSLSSRQANFDGDNPYGGARRGPNLKRTCPVGRYAPNAFGLYDTHGNVWEWCGDWFDEDYYERAPQDDPPGPANGENRVLRGGSFYYVGSSCRAAIRFGRRPAARSNLDGFRVAMAHEGGGH